MDFVLSELPRAVKVVIAGHFGVGKTTLVGSVSEVRPLRTEEVLTDVSVGVDDLSGVEAKHTTTVALDFGRITIGEDLVLYLFGTPGQDRFTFLWDELTAGAIGAVVLADTRRLTDSFACIDYFEDRAIPFVVAVNCFEGSQVYQTADVRLALDVDPAIPVLMCDARVRQDCVEVLGSLLDHVLRLESPE